MDRSDEVNIFLNSKIKKRKENGIMLVNEKHHFFQLLITN